MIVVALARAVAVLPFREEVRRYAVAASLIVVTVLSGFPLLDYYRYPKQDFVGALETVNTLAEPDDVRVGVQTAGNILNDYYQAGFEKVESLADLKAYERQGRPIWVVTTLERIMSAADPDLIEHLHSDYVLVELLPGTVGDGAMRIYGQPPRQDPR